MVDIPSDGNFRSHLGSPASGEIATTPTSFQVQERAMQDHNNYTKMRTLSSDGSTVTTTPILRKDDTYVSSMAIDATSAMRNSEADGANEATVTGPGQEVRYKVYKRRWFGLAQLVLL